MKKSELRQIIKEEMTQMELIDYYKKNLMKVISSHGVTDNDYFWYASYQLKGAEMGMSEKEIPKWANKKLKELNK